MFNAADDATAQAQLEAHINGGSCPQLAKVGHMATAGPGRPSAGDFTTKESVSAWTIRCNRCQMTLATGTQGKDDPNTVQVREAMAAHTCPAGTQWEGRITED